MKSIDDSCGAEKAIQGIRTQVSTLLYIVKNVVFTAPGHIKLIEFDSVSLLLFLIVQID